jgi:non-ribosomal peptide synthetase component F
MLLLAAFAVLLSHYSGREEIVVGTDVANRTRPETEGLIGFFVNQLVLRVGVRAGVTFRELLGRVREAALGAYAHQDVPFERLVEELRPERRVGRGPLFQVKLVEPTGPGAESEFGGLRVSGEWVESGTAQMDLIVSVGARGEEVAGAVEYSTEVYEWGHVGGWMEGYARVLEEVSRDEGASVEGLWGVLAALDTERRLRTEAELKKARLQKRKTARRESVQT